MWHWHFHSTVDDNADYLLSLKRTTFPLSSFIKVSHQASSILQRRRRTDRTEAYEFLVIFAGCRTHDNKHLEKRRDDLEQAPF